MGHARSDVADRRYRFWRVFRYLIAYRATADMLYIVRVVGGQQDLRRLFR